MSLYNREQEAHAATRREAAKAAALVDLYKERHGDLGGSGKPAPAGEPVYDAPFLKPGWKPETFEELQSAFAQAIDIGAKRALDLVGRRDAAVAQTAEEAKATVDAFITEATVKDATFDENDFYEFVETHKVPLRDRTDLDLALTFYNEVRTAERRGEERGRTKPPEAPVAAPGGPGGAPAVMPLAKLRSSTTADLAREQLKGGK